jgi:hypothetical protein
VGRGRVRGVVSAPWVLPQQGSGLRKFRIGPGGVTMEVVANKLDTAVQQTAGSATPNIGKAAKRSVLDRLRRDADLLASARIL